MPIHSRLTSYYALFQPGGENFPTIKHIEIPLIQRDYAQGREGAEVARIRNTFLDVLCDALKKPGPGICLDFVYGSVQDGMLSPLDGQQRLTTLFLLHWYLACRVECLESQNGWIAFTYATRQSARLFCERLVKKPFPLGTAKISAWIEDQSWYLPTWQYDPTIQSMRVMLDAIHDRFSGVADARPAWERLTAEAAPAVTFHLLPIEQMGLQSEELYIKMNSRGKPLTPFENFKALFEQVLEKSSPERGKEFGRLVDGDWTDVFWRLGRTDNAIDDEFLRYFQFVTEMCQWREGNVGDTNVPDLFPLAEKTFGPENPQAGKNLEFLFNAFNIWVNPTTAPNFERWFTLPASSPPGSDAPDKVVLFESRRESLDLFARCCADYGKVTTADVRVFGWRYVLLLYAVVLHAIEKTGNFPRQLRILRNLIEASADQLRQASMPGLIADVYTLVVGGTLEGVTTFNPDQVNDERTKAELLRTAPGLKPALFRLEDHDLLRGRVFAFELDPAAFECRAETFQRIFGPGADGLAITGALLATGDYSRPPAPSRFFLFGPADTHDRRWRVLWAEASRSALTRTREVLGRFLDAVASGMWPEVLQTLQQEWLAGRERDRVFGWRYYLVKYPAMRGGDSGMYGCQPRRMGYDVCMLDNPSMRGYYHDPYLLAIYQKCGLPEAVHYPRFSGNEWEPRRLRLSKTKTDIQCVPNGFQVSAQGDEAQLEVFSKVGEAHGVDVNGHLSIPQADRDGQFVDTQDRIEIGANLVRDLVEAGL